LSISPVSVSINPGRGSEGDDGWQQFAQLVRTVNAGDLAGAQKVYANFTKSSAADLAQANPNSRLAQALEKVGGALRSGDVGQAQLALAAMRPRAPANPTQPGPPVVKAPGISPAGPDEPGAFLNVTV
jgi:hypothetical protein